MLIAPDLGDISAATFDRSADAIRIGEEATRALAASLEALQPAAGAVRGAARRRRSPSTRRWARSTRSASQGWSARTRRCCGRWSRASPASRCPRRRSARDLRRIYGRGGFESISYHITGDGGPRAMVIEPQGEVVGARLPALRPRPRERLPGRQPVQPAGPVPQDLAQPPRRRVADRGPGRAGHASSRREFYQPLNAAGQLVRGALSQDRADDARRLRGRRQGRRLPRRARAGRPRRRRASSAPGGSCASVRCGRASTRASTRARPSCRRPRRTRPGSGRCCSSTRPITRGSRPAASGSRLRLRGA